MSVHPHEGDLHRHYDGELSARESWEIEAHLRECRTCATAYDAIGLVVARVGELPEAIEPPSDLWAGISQRIGAPPDELDTKRRGRAQRIRTVVVMSWVGAVAAALLLGIGLGRLFPPPGVAPVATGSDADLAAPASIAPAAVLASYEEPAYDQAIAELETILAGMRDQLEPETVAVVEENLAIIDAALVEARAALLADPANQQLHGHLSHTMQQKLRLLRMVTGAV